MNINVKKSLAAASTLALGAAFALGSASTAHAVETWTITNLSLTGAVAVDVDDTSGDDGGFLAPTKNGVVYNADDGAYTYDHDTFATLGENDAAYNDGDVAFVSDLKSNIAYQVNVGENDLITTITELDQDGNLGTIITLSEPIDVSASDDRILASGFGYLALWVADDGDLLSIAPDGTVTELDDGTNTYEEFDPYVEIGNDETSSYFKAAGVMEFDGTDYWFVGIDTDGGVSRFNLTGDSVNEQLLANPQGTSDSDTFNVSTCAEKFYLHSENNDGDDDWTVFFGLDVTSKAEIVVVGGATFSSAGDCEVAESPELANTGIDVGAGVALSVLLTGLGAVAYIVVRRRQVASN